MSDFPETEVDWLVIGAGPGGYVAAIRAAQLGKSVALVDKSAHLGGTCLNVGCIPSKAMLHSTEQFRWMRDSAKAHGVEVEGLRLNLESLQKRRLSVVESMRKGVRQLVEGRKVEVVQGLACVTAPGKVEVTQDSGVRRFRAERILIATGSEPVGLPFLPFDGKQVVSSTEALEFDAVPSSLIVIGGGAIGLELGSVWQRLGSKVTVLEFLPNIAATADVDLSKAAERLFTRQGMHVLTSTRVTEGSIREGRVSLKAIRNNVEMMLDAEKVLVCVGRRPFTQGLGLEALGVKLDAKGRIEVDGHYETNLKGIHAIGDVISGPMLAHKAEEEGVAVVESVVQGHGHVDADLIPNVIYTDPELASVGLTEAQAREVHGEVKVGRFNFAANGRAVASDHAHGLVKVIAHAKTDRILGVHLLGHGASELIASAVAHMTYGASSEDLARTMHAHPTLSEAMKEAALACDGRSLHALRP
jgi:dihydrolipoamide dehydrogenase